MSTDNVGAYQEICARVRSVVEGADMLTLVGYKPELRYTDKDYPKLPAGNQLWLRITMAGAQEIARTLGKPCRVTYSTTVGIQLFVPVSDTNAAFRGRSIANLVKLALARATANVTFYKAGIKDQPQDGQWFYKRIEAQAQYTEFGDL